jgi:hypothetical protein
MGKFIIEIDLGSSALPDKTGDDLDIAACEISRILLECKDTLERGYATWPIRDINGNTVGRAGFVTNGYFK